MQHGDDGERGAAGPAARRRASPGAAAASSSAAGSELSAASTSSSSSSPSTGVGAAQRAIPLGFLGRWLASEVGVIDEGTRLQDGVFAVTVTKCVHISRQNVVTELPQLMRVEYDDHGHPGFYLKVRLHEHISLFQKDERKRKGFFSGRDASEIRDGRVTISTTSPAACLPVMRLAAFRPSCRADQSVACRTARISRPIAGIAIRCCGG
jgi:hypothetical protein